MWGSRKVGTLGRSEKYIQLESCHLHWLIRPKFLVLFRFASIFSLHFADFPFVFASDFCCFASMWNKRNHAFFSLPSETKCSLQFQFSLPKRKRGRTLVLILHDAKMYENVRKLYYIFFLFYVLCCNIMYFFTLCNVYVFQCLRSGNFTFSNPKRLVMLYEV
jgi:hypothetical protein